MPINPLTDLTPEQLQEYFLQRMNREQALYAYAQQIRAARTAEERQAIRDELQPQWENRPQASEFQAR